MEDVRVNTQHSCFTNLHDHLLDLISEKLNEKDDRDSSSLTCHRLLKFQNKSRKCLKIKNCSCDLVPYVLGKLLNRFCKIQDLSLDNCREISDSDLNKLQNFGSTLHCLSLSSCFQITNIGIKSVASSCPLLSVISLFNCSVTDAGLEIFAKSCKYLIQVNLAYCLHRTDCGIQYISQNCRQLRALNIDGCTKIVGVFRGCSSTLANLEAACCAFDSTGAAEILSGGGLEYLKLSNPDNQHTM